MLFRKRRKEAKEYCVFRHSWSKWEDFWKGVEIPASVENPKRGQGMPLLIQERRCKVCNAAQRRKVSSDHEHP